MLFRVITPSVGLSLFLLWGILAEAKQPDGEGFQTMDRWYEVYLGKSKVGFAHSTMKLENGEVLSESIFEMKIKRAGQVIEMKVSERTRETSCGARCIGKAATRARVAAISACDVTEAAGWTWRTFV